MREVSLNELEPIDTVFIHSHFANSRLRVDDLLHMYLTPFTPFSVIFR